MKNMMMMHHNFMLEHFHCTEQASIIIGILKEVLVPKLGRTLNVVDSTFTGFREI